MNRQIRCVPSVAAADASAGEGEADDVALNVWDLVGAEALLQQPNTKNVVATGQVRRDMVNAYCAARMTC